MTLGTQYNYVIFGSDWDLYKIAYSSVLKYDNVRYIESPYVNLGLLKHVRHIHFSGAINKRFRVPFKGLWNSCYFHNDFGNDKPICFLFFWQWAAMEIETGFTRYLRRNYPGSKMVLFLQDVVASHKEPNINELRRKYDLLMSYDKKDCEKYRLTYHPTVLSSFRIKQNLEWEMSDFFFIGQDKGRLKTLIGLYDELVSKGFTCDFIIQGEFDPQIKLPSGIKHINKSITYYENLQHVVNTRCVIELMQPDADGFTYRTWESIIYDKFLLTNNKKLQSESFYIKNNMFVIDDDAEIDNFLLRVKNMEYVENKYKQELSAEKILEFITEKI